MRDIVKEINDKLNEIEEKEGVRVLHAVRSGTGSGRFQNSIFLRRLQYANITELQTALIRDTFWVTQFGIRSISMH